MRIIALMRILPFMVACSSNIMPADQKIDIKQNTYTAYQGSSYDLNKVKKIEILAKDRLVYYVNKFNVPSEVVDVYKNWYLVTGVTQSNGGWYYQASIKSRNVLLCLMPPEPFIPQLSVLKVPLLLVGVVNDENLIFDKVCVSETIKNGIKINNY